MDCNVNLRLLVMEMLLTENAYSHVIVRDVLNKYNYLTQQEKSFIKRLYEGTLERQIELDYVIYEFSKVKTRKMKKVIRVIMRMGVYQILYMDAVPDSAACNEAVALAGLRGFGGLKGFVNGVLRNIARNKSALPMPDMKREPVTALSVRYAMPEWLVCMFCEIYGIGTTQKMLAAMLDERLGLDEQEQILGQMRQKGIRVEQHPYLTYAYRLFDVDGIANAPGFEDGAYYVQDVSSMLVSEAAGIRKGMHILDLCAAPGGKSLHAAEKLCGTGLVESRDLTEYKVAMIEENRMRCHCDNLIVKQQDACVLCEEDIGQFDVVYADVPCSGLGIMGKKCDIRHRIQPDQIEELVVLQRKIIEQACRYVKDGGVLIYSTCTINPSENERQLSYITSCGLVLESLDPYLPDELCGGTARQGYLQLLPGIHETDGFFLARFRKRVDI